MEEYKGLVVTSFLPWSVSDEKQRKEEEFKA